MRKKSLLSTIIIAWLIAGTLDIAGAILILSDGNWKAALHYISFAVLGKETSISENGLILLGAGFHYLIALGWTIFYFLIYKAVKFDKINIILSALLYGALIFFAMRYVFIPLLGKLPAPKPITTSMLTMVVKNVLILSVAFGVTLKLFADKSFKDSAFRK